MDTEALQRFHETFAWVVVVMNLLAGTWALVAHRAPAVRHRSLWWFTGVAQATIVVQVVAGVVLRQQVFGGKDPDHLQFHMFYGFVALFAMAIIYSYRAQLKSRLYVLYGGGGLFLAGLALRAISLKPG
jgi:hypothetical protein